MKRAEQRGPASRDTVALLVALGDETARKLLGELGVRGLDIRRAQSAGEASSEFHLHNVEVVLAQADDQAHFTKLCEGCSDVPVIALVSSSSEDAGAEALRAGAVAVLDRDCTEADVGMALDRALGEHRGAPASEESPPPPSVRGRLLGDSEPMQRVADLIERTAPVDATALVRGETGTGKELVARALHDQSPRKNGPFIKVHCAALPDALLESELFGYEKGAFTGASTRKPGRVELAQHGTLFLDEIGDITPAVQVKLLRLLQDREYERLGGVQTIRADVRFVAATHRNLEGMVKTGDFREDLFYRLNVVTLWLPPLRARRDDIPLLARQFCAEFASTYRKSLELDDGAIQTLRSERWPGNVRQLQNFMERLVVLSPGPRITAEEMRREMTAQVEFKTQLTGGPPAPAALATDASPASGVVQLDDAVRKAERQAIDRALRHAGGNRTVAARILGVSRATLYTKLAEHEIP